MLPLLFEHYNAKLYGSFNGGSGAFWRVQVCKETKKRIEGSQNPKYDGADPDKIYGPWDEETVEKAVDEWNEEVLWNWRTGDATMNEDDEWVFTI